MLRVLHDVFIDVAELEHIYYSVLCGGSERIYGAMAVAIIEL